MDPIRNVPGDALDKILERTTEETGQTQGPEEHGPKNLEHGPQGQGGISDTPDLVERGGEDPIFSFGIQDGSSNTLLRGELDSVRESFGEAKSHFKNGVHHDKEWFDSKMGQLRDFAHRMADKLDSEGSGPSKALSQRLHHLLEESGFPSRSLDTEPVPISRQPADLSTSFDTGDRILETSEEALKLLEN